MDRRVTKSGIEHGLVGTLINQVPRSKRFRNMDAKRREENEKKLKHNSEIIPVRFVHYKNQINGSFYTDYSAGAGEPIYLFRFIHGHSYKIPRGLKEKMNDPYRAVPTREGAVDESGSPLEKDGIPRRTCEFVQDF